jgi:hydroxypyruvate isomerase
MTQFNRRHALASVATSAAIGIAAAGTAAAKPSRNVTEGLAPYAVNLDTWFKQAPFEQRFAMAKALGFKTIEFWKADRGDGMDARAIRKLADDNGLSIVQYAPTAPNFSDPAVHPDLLKMVESAITDSKILGCSKFTIVGHHLVDGMTREAMLAGYTTGLMRIAPMLEAAGITALVEPFNRVNHIGHLLNGSTPAVAMIKSVNSPRVKLLWDFYHMQLEEGDLIEKFTAAVAQVDHVQIGDVPGRHEPGTGEVNHANLLRAVRTAKFAGPIGLEFSPLDNNDARAVDAVLALQH